MIELSSPVRTGEGGSFCFEMIRETSAADSENGFDSQMDELDRINASLNRTRERLPVLHDLLLDLELF